MMKIPLATASLILLTILLSNTLPTNASNYADNIRLPNIQTSGYAFTAGWGATNPTIDGKISSKKRETTPTIEVNINYNIGDRITPGGFYIPKESQKLYLGIKVKKTNIKQWECF